MTHGHGWRLVLGGQDIHAQCRLAIGSGVTHSSVSLLMLRNTGPRNCAVVCCHPKPTPRENQGQINIQRARAPHLVWILISPWCGAQYTTV